MKDATRDIGARIQPGPIAAIKAAAMAACRREIARRGLKARHLTRLYGCTPRRGLEIYASIHDRGPDIGIECVLRLAECLDVPYCFVAGAEARQLPQLAAPSMVPALSDLTSRQVAA